MSVLKPFSAAAIAALLLCGCRVVEQDDNAAADANQSADANMAAPAPAAAPPLSASAQAERDKAAAELKDLRFLVDISDRKLRLFSGDKQLEEHDVAVGTREYPTKAGDWEIHQVDLNPEWTPPKNEEWAKKEQTRKPGDPENPMGRARLVYDMPRTIHGTDDKDSLGKRASHGSIRVSNDSILKLAAMALKAGGSWQGQQWFDQMTATRTEEHQLKLDKPIPVKVQD